MGGGSSEGGFPKGHGNKWDKQRKTTPRDNRRQNEQFNKISNELGLTREERERLHREITKSGKSYDELMESAKNFFNKETK